MLYKLDVRECASPFSCFQNTFAAIVSLLERVLIEHTTIVTTFQLDGIERESAWERHWTSCQDDEYPVRAALE